MPDRFWAKVDTSGGPDACWPWQAGKNEWGYGVFLLDGRPQLAHRVAWSLSEGQIPEGLCVLHDCPTGDNPACCNRRHLWLGTNAENVADKVTKGRQTGRATHGECFARGASHGAATTPERFVGEGNGRAKLTDDEVDALRARYTGERGQKAALAREFGTGKCHVGRILSGKNRTRRAR